MTLALYRAQLAAHRWGVEWVQRILPAPPARPARRVVCLTTLPTREAARERLATFAAQNGWPLADDPTDVTPRLVLYERADSRPTLEEQIVICPAVVQDKARSTFAAHWTRLVSNLELVAA